MVTAPTHRAVFLDRDGVLNRAFVVDGIPRPPQTMDQFELYPGVVEACHLLKKGGFLLVVATNQPDVERKLQSKALVESFHTKLQAMLPLDRIEVSYDAKESPRRKPAPGMLLDAAKQLSIDLASSYMVGDRWKDVECGKAAGCKTIFIDHHYGEHLRQEPDFKTGSLLDAARWITRGKTR